MGMGPHGGANAFTQRRSPDDTVSAQGIARLLQNISYLGENHNVGEVGMTTYQAPDRPNLERIRTCASCSISWWGDDTPPARSTRCNHIWFDTQSAWKSSTVTDNDNKKKEGTMFSIYTDLKVFVREHRGVLFTIVFVVLLDKYLFEGALRERLKGLINSLLSKAEKIATKE